REGRRPGGARNGPHFSESPSRAQRPPPTGRRARTGWLRPWPPYPVSATTIAVTARFKSDAGRRTFHPKAMSWSYRRRGNVARSQTKKKRNSESLIRNQATGGRNGPRHPPKKTEIATAETTIMFAYSARK